MQHIGFYSIERTNALSDDERFRYVDNLDVVKRLLFSELDNILSDHSHVSIHINYGEGSKPFYFDVYRHVFNILSENDI